MRYDEATWALQSGFSPPVFERGSQDPRFFMPTVYMSTAEYTAYAARTFAADAFGVAGNALVVATGTYLNVAGASAPAALPGADACPPPASTTLQ